MAQGDSKKTKPRSTRSRSTKSKQTDATEETSVDQAAETAEDALVETAENVADAEIVEPVAQTPLEETAEAVEEEISAETAEDPTQDHPIHEDPLHDDQGHLGDHHDGAMEEEHRSGSFSSKVLIALLLLLFGAGGALYGAPKLAPHLPEWASGLRPYLVPGGDKARAEVAALRSEVEEKIAAQGAAVEAIQSDSSADLEARLAEVEAAIAAPSTDVAAVKAEAGDLAERIEAMNTDLAQRIDAAEATIKGLRAEIGSLSSAAATATATEGEVGQAALARLQEMEASVEGLRAEMLSLADSNTKTVNDGLTSVRADLDGAREYIDEKIASLAAEAEARVEAANQEVVAVKQTADTEAAAADLTRQFQDGAPYADALAALAAATGATPPPTLSSAGDTGVSTLGGLREQLVNSGHKAIAASMKAASGDGLFGGLTATLESQFTGIPSGPTEGPEPPAVLSRARALLNEDDLAGALSELEALPSEARAAMQSWLDAATTRRDAEAEMSEFIKKAMPTQG